MDFEVLEMDWRKIGDYSECENYEHMFDCANNDVQRLLWIVNWVKGLDTVTFRLAITALHTQGFASEAETLEKWLESRPD